MKFEDIKFYPSVESRYGSSSLYVIQTNLTNTGYLIHLVEMEVVKVGSGTDRMQKMYFLNYIKTNYLVVEVLEVLVVLEVLMVQAVQEALIGPIFMIISHSTYHCQKEQVLMVISLLLVISFW